MHAEGNHGMQPGWGEGKLNEEKIWVKAIPCQPESWSTRILEMCSRKLNFDLFPWWFERGFTEPALTVRIFRNRHFHLTCAAYRAVDIRLAFQ